MLALILALSVLDPPTPREQFEALKADYAAKIAAWERKYPPDGLPIEKTKVDLVGRLRTWPAWSFTPRFLDFAEAYPDDPASADALFWVAEHVSGGGDRDRAFAPNHAKALEALARSHVDDPRIDLLCRKIFLSGSTADSARFLRTVSETARSREVRGRARYAYAHLLAARRKAAEQHWYDRGARSDFEAEVTGRVDPSYLRWVREVDARALMAEVEREYSSVIDQYGDVKARPYRITKETIAEDAGAELFAIRHLNIGQVAPEVEGPDVDDRPLRLSDYRGRVVVLGFSGRWHPGSLTLDEAQKALLDRYKGGPFAIVEVNTDVEKAALRQAIKNGRVAWRCWWDGGDHPICTTWDIPSFPTLYVLDAFGVIREKEIGVDRLETAVARLMAEVGPAKP